MKTVEIEFSEQSKAVVSKVVLKADDTDSSQLLLEAQELFSKAQQFALNKSFARAK